VSPEKPKELSVDEKSRGAYAKTGLSSEEVERKRQQYGSNEIPEKKVNPVRKFLGYFWGPIPWMIETAAVLSIIIQHWEDFVIIFTLLIVNAVVGFWQEHKADNAIALLKKRIAPTSRKNSFLCCRKHPSCRHANSCLRRLYGTYRLGISWSRVGLRAAKFHDN
jgi:H+-transporting ATPase